MLTSTPTFSQLITLLRCTLNIIISQGHQPPANPRGATIVIDVIRAFTTTYHAFANGVAHIWPVATSAEAFALQAQQPAALLAGEIQALPIEGFDFGNSPLELSQAQVAGKPLILRTTNGVIATLNAQPCQHLFVTGLPTAAATVNAVKALDVEQVVLVASHPTGDEDVACAEYMRGLLGGEGISASEASERTLNAKAAQKFYDGSNPRLRADDIHLAAQCDVGDFVMLVKQSPQGPYIIKGEA